jgi:hypothetical protein
MLDQRLFPLNSSKGYSTNFIALKRPPFLAFELALQREDHSWMAYIQESVSIVALIPGVDGNIKEVIKALMLLIDLCKESLRAVFIGNISDHDRRPRFLPSKESWNTDLIHFLVMVIFIRTFENPKF